MEIGPYGIPGSSTYLWKYMKLEHLIGSINGRYIWFGCLKSYEELEGKLNHKTLGDMTNYHVTGVMLGIERQKSENPRLAESGKARERFHEDKLKESHARQTAAKEKGALCLFENTCLSHLMWQSYGGGLVGNTEYVAIRFSVNAIVRAFWNFSGFSISRIKYRDRLEGFEPPVLGFEKDPYFINEMEVRVLVDPAECTEYENVKFDRGRKGYKVNFDWQNGIDPISGGVKIHLPPFKPPAESDSALAYIKSHKNNFQPLREKLFAEPGFHADEDCRYPPLSEEWYSYVRTHPDWRPRLW